MDKNTITIQPPSKFSLGLNELWQYRELFFFFAWRDIKVRYKQTYLGLFWALLQPLALLLLFSLLFKKVLNVNTGNLSYGVFVLSGLILWNLFYSSVNNAAESMVANSNIIKKIYFPRLIIPASAILTALFDLFIALILFFGFVIATGQSFSWNAIIYFPAAILLILLSALGAGSFLAALNIKYRDFRYALPFLLQLLFFASQIIYPLKGIQQIWLKDLLALNPVNGAIEILRSSFSGIQPDTTIVLISLSSSLLLLIAGIFYFRKTESYFADIA